MAKQGYSVDLIKQMAECDANYIRLLKLIPALQAHRERNYSEYADNQQANSSEPEKCLEGIRKEFVISAYDDCSEGLTVEISIQEAFKYTATLEIVQKPVFREWMTNPTMLVRVYHDACTAEVVSYQGHRNLQPRYSLPNPKMYHVDEKMQVNQFLGEWLSLCLKVGRSVEASNLKFSI